ncbi:MAG: glycosyltransferase family 9 protein [Gemmatimonadetes bacterium]|nr:glycosyltransferase family 9 protein [Gemmatimonadota bacterium]MYD24626.1 glycosyltransferase family 9 protein [Gemmatimonadota bacterium]MYI98103.1 glycosyltransferase family 9 protein [Gemmatimonadota bacterium]
MKRLLIIRSGAVGDLILTLPVLSALKKRYGGLSIDMMGDPVRLSLLKHSGFVDDVLSVDDRKFTPLFAPGGPPSVSGLPSDSVSRDLRLYDAMLSYLPDPDGVFVENLRRIASGPVFTGQSRPPDGRRFHMTRVLLDALKPLGIGTSIDLPRVDVPSSATPDDVRELDTEQRLVAIHPGSGGAEKCWPVENYGALIDQLTGSGFRPMLTFGPADHMVRRRLLPWIESRDVLVIEDRSLVEVAALYARCRAMIGNDTGMTHLAAAAGTPVIALFGPTDPAVWGPRGKDLRVLWGTDVFDGDVDGIKWKAPFRPRSLDDIDAMAPFQFLSGFCTAAGGAEHK